MPANSLIQLTHNLSSFLIDAYNDLKEEVKSSKVLHADETPHKMLEGDKKSNWYLWGFSNDKSAYFELQDTRSGDIASSFLKGSACEYLVTDVFSGYSKAVRDANVLREEINKNLIKNIYCNAHARRKFKESAVKFEIEGNYFIKCYQKIYKLEQYLKDHESPLSFEQIRHWQKIYFDLMNRMAIALHNSCSTKSSLGKAIRYFIRNFDELIFFLKFNDIPIDNNSQERLMRNPVIGRKTWYGTHSKRGAQTNAILFSLVESCKINKINPRDYFRDLVEAIHLGKSAFTPAKYENIAE